MQTNSGLLPLAGTLQGNKNKLLLQRVPSIVENGARVGIVAKFVSDEKEDEVGRFH